MEETSFRVMEDVGIIELCTIVATPDIECPVKFPFNIHLYTADGTASKVYCTCVKCNNPLSLLIVTVEEMDYGALDVVLMFEMCMRRKCVNVTIIEDQMNELNESFTFHLNSSTNISSHFNFGSAEGIVHIINNDGENFFLYIEH